MNGEFKGLSRSVFLNRGRNTRKVEKSGKYRDTGEEKPLYKTHRASFKILVARYSYIVNTSCAIGCLFLDS